MGGNEGLGEVTGVGEGVKSLKRGDWVVMKAGQLGTWRSAANVPEGQVLKVPRLDGLSEVNAATMMVRLAPLWLSLLYSAVRPFVDSTATGQSYYRILPFVGLRRS